jgi:hypothetical protein
VAIRTRKTDEVNAALIEFLRRWQLSAMLSYRYCDFVSKGLHGTDRLVLNCDVPVNANSAGQLRWWWAVISPSCRARRSDRVVGNGPLLRALDASASRRRHEAASS